MKRNGDEAVRKRRRGKPLPEDWEEIAKLASDLEAGVAEVTLEALAKIRGIHRTTMTTWVRFYREKYGDPKGKLTSNDKVYLAKRYRQSKDPEIRAFLRDTNVFRRKRIS